MEILVKKTDAAELESMGVNSWAIWSCEPSRFDWEYEDRESCHILEGRAIVRTVAGETEIRAGDFVVFPKGLKCVWDVKAPIRKRYKFG